jgi:SnoaL-like polyketide cyclase
MPIDAARLQEFARSYTAAWCSQNAASVAAHYAHRGSLTVNGGEPAVGRQAIMQVAQSFMTAFPDLKIFMDGLRLREEHAEYHWILIGTNNGPEGTGKQVRITGVEVWQINADGLIASSTGNFDNAEYQRQLRFGYAAP